MTPDPYTNSGRLNDPQSWNRYAYTRGDPVNRHDPAGADDCPADTICITVTGYPIVDGAPGGGFGGSGGNSGFDPSQPISVAKKAAEAAGQRPALAGTLVTEAENALKLAEQLASNKNCDQALSADGISSLSALLQSIALSGSNANVFNGTTSTTNISVNGYTTMEASQFFAQYGTQVGAVAFDGTASSPGAIFLGPAFANPGIAGAQNSAYTYFDALILMHEAAHAIGNLTDAAGGGSKAINQALVSNCAPVLANQLGGLGN